MWFKSVHHSGLMLLTIIQTPLMMKILIVTEFREIAMLFCLDLLYILHVNKVVELVAAGS